MRNEYLAKKLKYEILKKNKNACKLARDAGVGKSFVYDILSGKSSNPTAGKLYKIADALGIEVGDLINGVDIDNSVKITSIDSYGKDIKCKNEVSIALTCSRAKMMGFKSNNLYCHFIENDIVEYGFSLGDFVIIDVDKNSSEGCYLIEENNIYLIKKLSSKDVTRYKNLIGRIIYHMTKV